MSHPDPQPETHGAGHHSQTPQVAVRDGNRLLCPCCGEVLMVLKEQTPTKPIEASPPKPAPVAMPDLEAIRKQVFDQLKAAFPSRPRRPRLKFDPSEADKGKPDPFTDHLVLPIDPLLASYEFPADNPPSLANPMNSSRNREPKPKRKRKPLVPLIRLPHLKKRKKRWRPLRNAYSYRMARHYAWTFYWLKKLNVQLVGEVAGKRQELHALQQELLGPAIQSWAQENPPVESCASAETTTTSCEPDSIIDTANQHAQADLGVAPGLVGVVSTGVVSSESIDEVPGVSLSMTSGNSTCASSSGPIGSSSAEPISGMASSERSPRVNQSRQANDANQAHEANERGPP